MDNGYETARLVNIVGERIALGPLRADLIETYERWLNDFSTMRTQGDLPGPRTRERTVSWYERVSSSTESIWFLIYEKSSWTPIGFTWLDSIDYRHRTGGFAISIGEESMRGKGYGTETIRLMLDFAFTALGLHNVSLEVYSHNIAGQCAYERAGFHEYGRRHECFYMGGQFYDEILMECLSTEFESPVLAQVLTADPIR
jgi:RimJ/RimL family protein N-acetyltransferase